MLSPIAPDERIPVYRPYLGTEVQEAARQALEAGWLGMGRLSRQFEQGLERYLGLNDRRVVSTNSCTEALHIAGRLIGLGPGDEVICPSFTYVAGHQAISRTGADIVFCDVEDDHSSIDPERVARTGHRPHPGDPRRRLPRPSLPARRPHATSPAGTGCGSSRTPPTRSAPQSEGRPVGSFGDITCFSFGPVKMITTLEGGAVITSDPADIQALHELRHLGIDSDTDARYRNQRNWEFDVVRQGYRCHLGSVPAAIGLAQLELVDEFIHNRQNYCRRTTTTRCAISSEHLTLFDTDWKDVAPYIYVLRVNDGSRRQDLIQHLEPTRNRHRDPLPRRARVQLLRGFAPRAPAGDGGGDAAGTHAATAPLHGRRHDRTAC